MKRISLAFWVGKAYLYARSSRKRFVPCGEKDATSRHEDNRQGKRPLGLADGSSADTRAGFPFLGLLFCARAGRRGLRFKSLDKSPEAGRLRGFFIWQIGMGIAAAHPRLARRDKARRGTSASRRNRDTA